MIPTYQRRGPIERLLRALDAQRLPELDAVVVVDGSTDGTVEMLEQLRLDLPLRVIVRSNAGQGAARNAGLRAVDHDGIVWFLDDDMVPTDGLAAAHLRAHGRGRPRIVMGPCLFPDDLDVVRDNRVWANQVFDMLSRAGRVDDPQLFSVANTSAPVSVWREVGPLHEGFRGWGAEDHELGVRVLRLGIEVGYEPDAVAWHLQDRNVRGMCRTKEEEGANRVRLVRLHPDEADVLFPVGPPWKWARRFRFLTVHPLVARAVARSLARGAELEQRLVGSSHLLRPAGVASLIFGVVTEDPSGVFARWMTRGRGAGDGPPTIHGS